MKQIRILTGAHSGAQVRLTPGDYRIGTDDDADICVSDWTETGIWVSVDDAGVTRWCNVVYANEDGSASEDDPVVTLVPDLTPVPFGDIVICIGPEDQEWPADVDLLRSLWVKPPVPEEIVVARRMNPKFISLALGGGMLGALLVAGATLFGAQPSNADTTPNPQALAQRIEGELHGAGLTGLRALPRGNAVVVEGMVPTAGDDVAARGIFERVVKDQSQILRQYDVAEDDRRNIEDSLGIRGVHVSYSGNGTFTVGGTVASVTQLHTALARVKTDLDSNIKRIDVAVNEMPGAQSGGEYSEVIAIGNVRYVETPDGVKHLYSGAANTDNHG